MPIDIDELTESELVDLNHRIVARLRFLHEMHSHESMLECFGSASVSRSIPTAERRWPA
jgi:hypothetical protein